MLPDLTIENARLFKYGDGSYVAYFDAPNLQPEEANSPFIIACLQEAFKDASFCPMFEISNPEIETTQEGKFVGRFDLSPRGKPGGEAEKKPWTINDVVIVLMPDGSYSVAFKLAPEIAATMIRIAESDAEVEQS